VKFERRYSVEGTSARDQVEWKLVDASIAGVLDQRGVEVPAAWSQNAVNILARNYLLRARVPFGSLDAAVEAPTIRNGVRMPAWLLPRQADPAIPTGGETSAHQVFHRLVGHWTYWGWREGLFSSEDQAQIFYDELYLMLARQVAAPNSPQFFNTGLWWAYGIEGSDTGQWRCDQDGLPHRVLNGYEYPQPHACFLTSVSDDLVNEGGIMDLWVREARIFKHGSGSGVNPSNLRGKGEKLSGGGVASGLMSWLRIGDCAAGAIQSGGTTRRAAKMVAVDADHPEIEDFVEWKVREEAKAAAMFVGSRLMRDQLRNVGSSSEPGLSVLGIPEAMINRARQGIEVDEFGIGWEGEAFRTVSGQNANDSVRVTDAFMDLSSRAGQDWHLTSRTTGEVLKTVKANELWDKVCRAAWASADPGLLFHNTINAWNTCAADGMIRTTNPCAEFHHLDGSACLLASLRLTAFLRSDGSIDFDAYEHAARFWTVVLDLSVSMASFPAREFAVGAYNYRTLGLGYADLGGLLMRLAMPYDSDDGRALAAGLTALMTSVAYRTSAELAEVLGSFPRWEENADAMHRVLRNHRAALFTEQPFEELSIEPYRKPALQMDSDLRSRALKIWNAVVAAPSFRNAQATLLAPTGTISFVMDCDTTGVEPDLALVKEKRLAGGGSMRIVNQAVPIALDRLGYAPTVVAEIVAELEMTGELSLRGASSDKREARLAVFDCANAAVEGGRSIDPMGHVLMVAAVQPFLSGAVSKTINLPRSATVADVNQIYREAHRLGLKAVALYRDGSKLTQPLSGAKPRVLETATVRLLRDAPAEPKSPTAIQRGVREFLPWRREGGLTQKIKIDDQSIYLTVNPFPDGRPGEMFLELSHQGSTLRAMADLLSMAVSVGLQYGVPVAEYVERFCHTKFEPAGVVEGHDRIKLVSSIGDYLGRELGITYLGDDSLGQVRPAVAINTGDSVVALDTRAVGIASGYSGDVCGACGNATMRRAGTCLACETCGATTGCG
jgi:ribonucleoside-diphosphate reductase alpha chain